MEIMALAHQAGVGIETAHCHVPDELLPPALREASGDPRNERAKASGFLLGESREPLASPVRSVEWIGRLDDRSGQGAIDACPLLDAPAGPPS